MITSVFKKSTPINYSLIVILMVSFFFLYQVQDTSWTNSLFEIGKKIGLLLLLFGTLFLSNFIAKKNGLTKNSGFFILFYFLFLLLFPDILNNYNLILANFFVTLSMRRLISLQTLKAPKEKIFDAALWIFVASLFQFWCILFLIIVYVSIIFHVSRDYRNWLLPFIAFFTLATIFIFYVLLIDKTALGNYISMQEINLKLDYFANNYQNIAFSIYTVFVLFFTLPFVLSLTNKPLNLQASYKKIVFGALLGIIIFIISMHKSNELLIFTFLPLSVMAANMVEYMQNKLQQELVLFTTIVCSFFAFFSQL